MKGRSWIKRGAAGKFRKSYEELKEQRKTNVKKVEAKFKMEKDKRDINLLTFDELKKLIFKKEE
jgi:hypothetical protein